MDSLETPPSEGVETPTDQTDTDTIPLAEHLRAVLLHARAMTALQGQLDSATKVQPPLDDTSPIPTSADHSNCIDLLHHQNLVAAYNRRLDCAHDGFVSIASHEARVAQLQDHVHRLQAEAAEASAVPPRTELPDPIHPGLRLDDQSVYIASLQQIVQEQRGRMDREASSNSDSLWDAERQRRLLEHQCAEAADDLELH